MKTGGLRKLMLFNRPSTLCLGDDPPEDCYPSGKSQGIVSLNIMSQTVNILLGMHEFGANFEFSDFLSKSRS